MSLDSERQKSGIKILWGKKIALPLHRICKKNGLMTP